MSKRNGIRVGWMAIGVACALACASTAPPDDVVGRAHSAIDAAEKAGAAQDAPLAMRKSRDHLAAAEKAMAEKHNDQARRAAEAAEVDAQYALAEARRAKDEREYQELSKTVNALQEDTHDHP